MTALSDLLNNAKGDRSVDELIAAAEKRGHDVHPTFRALAYKALSGKHAKNPREESLVLLAQVFELDVRDLRQAVDRPAGELGPWSPVDEAAQLSQPIRDALDDLIKAIVRGGQAHGNAAPTIEDPPDQGGSVTPIKKPPPRTSGGAARQAEKPAARRTGKGTRAQRESDRTE